MSARNDGTREEAVSRAETMTPRDLLITGAGELGISLNDGQVNALFVYLSELRKWNRRINLTAIRGERDAIIKNVLDSLSYVKGFASAQDVRLLDMGSGAGFPAIPLKIAYPLISTTLVEATKKKAAFLRHVVRTLGLSSAEIMDVRTDELPASCLSAYDVVTARAFADMHKAITAGAAFLRPGGHLVLSRGPEETISDREPAEAGLRLQNRIEFLLPYSDYRRVVWVFRKQ